MGQAFLLCPRAQRSAPAQTDLECVWPGGYGEATPKVQLKSPCEALPERKLQLGGFGKSALQVTQEAHKEQSLLKSKPRGSV